ncbi:DNA polymerase III subunit delta [Candidatus Magnetomoraceae bacterium gMMP-15]
MSEINYKALSAHLKDIKKDEFPPVYLIYGDEFLYKTALKELIDAMIPESLRSLNYEAMDGISENIPQVVEGLNTFSLMPGTRVIAILDSKIFYSSENREKILKKAKDNENLSVPDIKNQADILTQAIEKGFIRGNHLIITTDILDKRTRLYKIIQKKGIIIECAIPKGNRKVDKDARTVALSERMTAVLSKSEKTMNRDAFLAMQEMSGFNLRSLSNSLNKLITYVGKRKKITKQDVEAVLERTGQDPIYEFTNAFAQRDIIEALNLLENLLENDFFPLQLLAALVNQTRKLLIVKDFIESSRQKLWKPNMHYNVFKNQVMPAVIKYDKALNDEWKKWHEILKEDEFDNDSKAKKKAVPALNLLIAKNPRNSYPVYQTFIKSEQFTKAELIQAMEILFKTDKNLKSTGQNPKLVLEQAIINICNKI